MPIETTDVVLTAVSALLGGGAFKAVDALLKTRATVKKIGVETKDLEQKAPLETNLIAIKGSENAVLIMQDVNERLVDENTRLRITIDAKDARILKLEQDLEGVHAQLLTAHDLAGRLAIALEAVQGGYDAVRTEISTLKQLQHGPDAPGGTT